MITLAVDDKPVISEYISKLMYEIDPEGTHISVHEQKDAIESVEKYKPDIIWLDIEMPGMNGLNMAVKIKEISPETNIVFVTGYSDYAVDAFGLHVSGFVLKPVTKEKLLAEIDNLRRPISKPDNKLLDVRCFGNFEVFCKGEIVRFSRSISKEAFAYLIDRRGSGCTVSEICSVLWEDRHADSGLKSQCRVIMSSLKKDLAAVGAEDVISKMWNVWSINTDKINCDYYDFLRSDSSAINRFRGEYMSQYSWAEMTIGNLINLTE